MSVARPTVIRMTITIEPATAARWDDAASALTGGGDGKTCWCQWWYLPNAEWSATSVDARRDRLHDELAEGPPRALVAYVDGEAAGWCRVAPRVEQARLLRTRLLAASDVPKDATDAWAITCLVVRGEHRGKGVAQAMVGAAIGFAAEQGAAVVEGYPIDTSDGKKRGNELYHGTLSMFLEEGFVEVARSKPDRPIVRLDVRERNGA